MPNQRQKSHRSALAAAAVALLLAVPAMLWSVAPAGAAAGFSIHNPQRDGLTGRPLSCPDPSVIGAVRGHWRYFLLCTSDNAGNAFPIWMSEDLQHWYPDGVVFAGGHEPAWAVPSGPHTRGRFWAPSIYRIGNRWVVYFAAQYNPASRALPRHTVSRRTMVIGVATSRSLAGPWHTAILHWPGQFNAVNGPHQRELVGGDIDPGVVRDPRSGQLYLFWAEQRTQIWEGALSPDGMRVDPHIRVALNVTEPWECDPLSRKCTVEGPEPFFHDGQVYLLYSAASTWDGSYAVGSAAALDVLDPAHPFVKLAQPILHSAGSVVGPGRVSHPITGPGGESLILYHALLAPSRAHISASRILMLGTLSWHGGWPAIGGD